MKIVDYILRKHFTKYYIRRGIARTEREHEKKLKDAGQLSLQERYDLESYLHQDYQEWDEWRTEIEDKELLEKAAKMDISLDDFPLPPFEDGDLHEIKNSHYCYGQFGERLLRHETRLALRKRVRERAPDYRKERREVWALWIQIGATLTGVIGATTGLFAMLNN